MSDDSDARISNQHGLISTLREKIQRYENQVGILQMQLQREAETRQALLSSTSWRITRPLRYMVDRWLTKRSPLPSGSNASGIRKETAEPGKIGTLTAKQLFERVAQTQLRAFLTSGSALAMPNATAPVVSIVLVLYNKAALTFSCLRSIRECASETSIEVIIVDNASADETGSFLARLEGTKVIHNSENRGFLLACNQAAQEARGRNLLFLNNDALLVPGALSAAVETLDSSDSVGSVGARIILLDGSLQESGSIVWNDGSCAGYGRGEAPEAPEHMFQRDVDFCSGAFLLTPRSTFLEMGGFDEAYAPAYYEEADYCLRLKERGLRNVYDPRATILHYEFASSDSDNQALEQQRKNRQVFVEHWQSVLSNHLAPDSQPLRARSARRNVPRVLFFDDRVPHRSLGHGFPRANDILWGLSELGSELTLYPLETIDEGWLSIYADIPRTVEIMTGWGREGLDRFLEERRDFYDLVIVSRPHNGRLVKQALASNPDSFRSAVVVYDAEAVFSIREMLKEELDSGRILSGSRRRAIIRDEVSIADFADTVLTVSEAEKGHFLEAGFTNVNVLGHMLKPHPESVPFEERNGFLFVGAMPDDSSPNADALAWFLAEAWPLIRKALGEKAKLRVVGISASTRVLKADLDGVDLLGYVDDLAPVYALSRVFIAPHRFAAGVPYKVHEATSHGVPSAVSDLIGEQLGWDSEDALLRAPTGATAGFADACLRLHRDGDLWRRIAQGARLRVKQDCSPETFEATLRELLATAAAKKAVSPST